MMRKKAKLFVLLIAVSMLLCSCGMTTDQPETDTTAAQDYSSAMKETNSKVSGTTETTASVFADSPYRVIMEAYQNGIRTKYMPTEEYPEGGYVGNTVWGHEVTDLYYALIDLCHDGQPELFIASDDGDEMNLEDMRIYDAWGCSEGKPARLFNDSLGWRGSFTIHKDGTILYDSQAISGEYTLYTVEKDGALVSGRGVSMDMGKEYYSHEYWAFNERSDTATISQAEYEAFYDEMDAYEPMTDIQWIAFSQD